MFAQPQFLNELPFQVSTHHIIDKFIQDAEELHFTVVEKEVNQVIVIQENVAQITATLRRMVCLEDRKPDDGTLCIVKLQLDTNQVKCIRLVQVKGVIGVNRFGTIKNYKVNGQLVDRFSRSVDAFKAKHKSIVEEPPEFYNEASEFTGISSENLAEYYNLLEYQQALDLSSNPYYLETTAFYMFHKIFCASNYGLGKKIAAQIKSIEVTIESKELDLTALRHMVEDIGSFITQIVDTLFMSFNFGKQETRQIMPFCRLSTEKYLYLRLYDKIYPLYKNFYALEDQRFVEKTKQIQSHFTIEQIKTKYQILEVESSDDQQKLDSAISEINKLSVMQTPREKVRCFQIMNSILKAMNNTFLEEYRKICFIVCQIQDPYTQIHFLIDGGANLDRKFLHQIKKSLDAVQEDFNLI